MPPPPQSFKEAALAAAAKKKANQHPPSKPRSDRHEPCTPDLTNEEDQDLPSPRIKKRKVPPAVDYEQAFTVSDDVRLVKPKHKSRQKETEHQQDFIPLSEPSPPRAVSPHFTMFRDFLLNHPSILESPIDSHSLPNLFNNPNHPALYSTDMVAKPLSAAELDIFMTGQPSYQKETPTYDATAVENALGYMFHLVTDFFAHRPHVVPTEKADRANLFTKMNIVSRALLHTKQEPAH